LRNCAALRATIAVKKRNGPAVLTSPWRRAATPISPHATALDTAPSGRRAVVILDPGPAACAHVEEDDPCRTRREEMALLRHRVDLAGLGGEPIRVMRLRSWRHSVVQDDPEEDT
jgi:hypothetical protein